MMLLLLLACLPRNTGETNLIPVSANEESAESTVPCGTITANLFSDARYPLSVVVPAEWDTIIGHEGGNPRLTLVDPETRARLEVSVRPGAEIGPAPRRGCEWTFSNLANYRVLNGFLPIQAASCTPDDPLHARVLGYFVVQDGDAFDFLSVVPPGALRAGKHAIDRALSGVRLRERNK